MVGPKSGRARLDQAELLDAIERCSQEWTESARDIDRYLASQVGDGSDRDVIGPLLAATGGSGVVRFGGREVGRWGDASAPEMAFSATKSVISVVAGIAFDTGLLVPEQRVYDVLGLPELASSRDITWEHLLQQTSQWEGTLWTKPTSVDVQSYREGTEVHGTPPGQGWAYNDVRVNLLTYALTVLFGRSLEEVLREEVMTPIGASPSWSWHGYASSHVEIDGASIPVVSGGAHWGGGLFISAEDFALIGQLYLDGGRWGDRQVISAEWITRSWSPCDVKPEYGYLWWLNDGRLPWPTAPSTGRGARGNGGRHLLWVDPARELVLCARWTECVHQLLAEVSAAITPPPPSSTPHGGPAGDGTMSSVLIQFLSSGILGALKVGLSSEEVVRQLGPAWDTSRPSGGAVIWKYGPLQVTIKHGRIALLALSCLDESPLPAVLGEVTVPARDTALYAFLALLDEHEVPWQVDPEYSFDRQLCILTGGGVRAFFDLDHRELQKLLA